MWLIDAYDFNKDITEYFCWKRKMFNPPTEWQEGYLYALDEFQRNLENRETVKAIPIEWIKETIKLAESVQHTKYAEHLLILLEDWEKENEID